MTSATDTTNAGASTHPGRTPVFVIILVSYLMIVLDISIVITALPKIHTSLGFSATGLSWVQNAYTLAFGGLLLLGARAGDMESLRFDLQPYGISTMAVEPGFFRTELLVEGASTIWPELDIEDYADRTATTIEA